MPTPPPLNADFRRFTDPEGQEFRLRRSHPPRGRRLGRPLQRLLRQMGGSPPLPRPVPGLFPPTAHAGSDYRRQWLFLCDAHGAFDNGTYYSGEHGDPFVERAVIAIVEQEMDAPGDR